LSKLKDLQRVNFEDAASALNTSAADAVATLRAGLFSESAATRIRAAVAILNLALITVEIRDLETRLLRVEKWTQPY